MKATILTYLAAALFTAFNCRAFTIEELSGVYVGKSTFAFKDTGFDFVQRYDQVTVIETNRTMTIYRFARERGQLEFLDARIFYLAEDGSFIDTPDVKGFVRLNGKHLTLTVQFVPPPPGERTLQIQGHRIGNVPDLLGP